MSNNIPGDFIEEPFGSGTNSSPEASHTNPLAMKPGDAIKTGAPISVQVLAIRSQQAAFTRTMDALIATYRAFDVTPRKGLKTMMKALREELAKLGETVGVSRVSLDSLWKG